MLKNFVCLTPIVFACTKLVSPSKTSETKKLKNKKKLKKFAKNLNSTI